VDRASHYAFEAHNIMNNKTLDGKSQRQGITITKDETTRRSGVIYSSSGNLVIVKTKNKTVPTQFNVGIRDNIYEFSRGSCLRMRRYLRECLSEYKVMVTLTYPEYFPANGRLVKEHLHRFLQELRRESVRGRKVTIGLETFGSPLIEHSSFWFLEFQERGAPHFHLFTTQSASKEWVAATWSRIVASEDEYHAKCGTRIEFIRSGRSGMASYVAKYAAKSEQKAVPIGYENVGRFWGVYGRRSTLSAATFVTAEMKAENTCKKQLKALEKAIELMIFDGYAEIYKREYGVLVLHVFDKYHQRIIRGLIARLSTSTMMFDTMFGGAELDLGEQCAT